MPKNVPPENRTEAARTFVEHLRRHPAEARQDPAALAARFGLETEFVRRALARLPKPERAEAPRGRYRMAEGAGGVLALFDGELERAARNPVAFEAISLVAATLGAYGLGRLLTGPLAAALSASLFVFAIAAQMAVFYRRRMVRYALYGGLLFGTATALVVMALVWRKIQNLPTEQSSQLEQGLVVFAMGLVMLALGGVYAALAALASLGGGWVQLRRADQEWERLSRQELLERYFELQRRLDQSASAPDEPEAWESWPTVAAVRRHPEVAGAAGGAILGLLDLVLSLVSKGADDSWVFLLLNLTLVLVALATLIAVSFLSGRVARGAAAGAAFATAEFAAAFLVSAEASSFSSRAMLFALQLGVAIFLGALAGVGATIQRRAARESQMQQNDGATLVAEMLEIQWRLEEDATSVTVLVADAAKSTAMKVGADPLDVEYSFREYQMWIAEICAGFGGRIHSVAGDGAVVAFGDGASAIAAARRLQTDVARFNAEVNRLPKPFRLRLGLHAGRVAGDLNDVQFTEVIDIAAHVEDIAPVGGIAATGAVVLTLGEEGFLPLARDVDGQAVYIALVPTEA